MMSRRYIPQLDGLRALAILPVLLAHAGPDFTGIRVLAHLDRLGVVGVQLFFVLSGFLITGILINAKDHEGYFLNFFARRGLRIWPLYYAALLFIFATSHFPKEMGIHWHVYALYFSNLYYEHHRHQPGPLIPMWSLAVEEQFYLVWPFLVWLVSRKNLKRGTFVLLTVVPILRLLLPWDDHTTLFQLDALGLGAFLACIDNASDVTRKIASFVVWQLPLGIILLFTAVPHAATKMLIVYGSGALLVLALKDASRLAAMLRNPVLMYIGRISYGIYLLHAIVFGVLRKTQLHMSLVARHSLILDLAFIAAESIVAIGLASASFYLFEKPILSLKRYFIPHEQPATSRVVTTADYSFTTT
jgi:peptidoglycan/LPS O-acetylase OafA/YrhL